MRATVSPSSADSPQMRCVVSHEAHAPVDNVDFLGCNGSSLRLEFDVDLKQVRPLNRWHKEEEIEKEPKIRRNLILAHQLQRLFDEGKVKSLKQTSEWLNFDQARLDHLMTMLLIAPDIQNEILNGDKQTISLIPEYKVRSLAAEIEWKKQTQIWQDIKKTTSKN